MGRKSKSKKVKTKKEQLLDKLKIEAAQELGFFNKAKQLGWDELTAQETGKIGALVKKKLEKSKHK